LKEASDELLTQINDIICEWIEIKEIDKIAKYCQPHSIVGILKPPNEDDDKNENENDNQSLELELELGEKKIKSFVYEHLISKDFKTSESKSKAMYVRLFEFYRKYIIGENNPATHLELAKKLKDANEYEIEEDHVLSDALEMYIPLQANDYPYDENISKRRMKMEMTIKKTKKIKRMMKMVMIVFNEQKNSLKRRKLKSIQI